MPWFWRSNSTSKSGKLSDSDAVQHVNVRVVERQPSRGSSLRSFISRRGSADETWERESMGIELQPSSHSSLMSSSDTSSQGVRIADPADALPASSKGQTSAFMVAELEVEEPPAPSSDQKKKTTGNGIGSNGGMLDWRPRGSSIVSLKHIGRKKSNSVSSVQQLSQPQPLPVSEDT